MKSLLLPWLFLLAALAAQTVYCPVHDYASCYDTGRIVMPSGNHIYHCTCGDDVVVGK